MCNCSSMHTIMKFNKRVRFQHNCSQKTLTVFGCHNVFEVYQVHKPKLTRTRKPGFMKQILKLVIAVCTKVSASYNSTHPHEEIFYLSMRVPCANGFFTGVAVFLTRIRIRVLGFGPAQTQPCNIREDKVQFLILEVSQ